MRKGFAVVDLAREIGLAAGIWLGAAVLYGLAEGLTNISTGLFLPFDVLALVMVFYVLVSLLGGVCIGTVMFAWQRWKSAGQVRVGPFYIAAFLSGVLFIYLALPINEWLFPNLLSPVSILGNTLLLGGCVGVLIVIYRHLRHKTIKHLSFSFLLLSLSFGFFISMGLYIDTFLSKRALLLYPSLFVGCCLFYFLVQWILRTLTQGRKFSLAKGGLAVAVLVVVVLSWARYSSHSAAGGMAKESAPNIVWIIMDTTRADHLSVYGYPRKTTPNIDRIAEEGVLFENAFAQSSWTIPSHFQMITSVFMSGMATVLDSQFVTAAEILKERGYQTGAIVANTLLGRNSGFGQGFETHNDGPPVFLYWKILKKMPRLQSIGKLPFLRSSTVVLSLLHEGKFMDAIARADLINRYVFRWLEGRTATPFFLFINYLDPHDPYDPPSPFKERFAPGVNSEKGFLRYHRESGRFITSDRFVRDVVSRLKAEDWRDFAALYDGEIAFLDSQIGALVSKLKSLGLYDRTILILTSDHGEFFGEHGLAMHAKALYEEVIRVPLIMRYPGKLPEGKRVSVAVELVDIFPTLLDTLGIAPEHGMDGKSFLPLMTGDGKGEKSFRSEIHSYLIRKPRAQYPHSAPGHLIALRTDGPKYIWSSTGMHAFYNMSADPKELNNMYHSKDTRIPDFSKRVESWRKKVGVDDLDKDEKLDDLTIKRLRSLGYIQ